MCLPGWRTGFSAEEAAAASGRAAWEQAVANTEGEGSWETEQMLRAEREGYRGREGLPRGEGDGEERRVRRGEGNGEGGEDDDVRTGRGSGKGDQAPVPRLSGGAARREHRDELTQQRGPHSRGLHTAEGPTQQKSPHSRGRLTAEGAHTAENTTLGLGFPAPCGLSCCRPPLSGRSLQ